MSKQLLQITDRFTDETLFEAECETLKECVEMAVKQGVSLQWANLRGGFLQWAKLEVVELRGAILTDANLTDTNLTDAILTDAILTKTILDTNKGETE